MNQWLFSDSANTDLVNVQNIIDKIFQYVNRTWYYFFIINIVSHFIDPFGEILFY